MGVAIDPTYANLYGHLGLPDPFWVLGYSLKFDKIDADPCLVQPHMLITGMLHAWVDLGQLLLGVVMESD